MARVSILSPGGVGHDDMICLSRGIIQGHPSSPSMLVLVINDTLQKSDVGKRGINIYDRIVIDCLVSAYYPGS